ncbi:ATP-binding protein [Natronosporangium hydrolyticum]|uniref:ATP-binding protein n=1 Tax=Natronosporangium hydrolyticum TaxID=2811111 RepID=A0A895YB52_9ACTN|nr:ATP-binding protein [Natronosporangium hydrolyticum]QSB14641.1 ATP-binding protein [Natronosporangium hydrolyticum]
MFLAFGGRMLAKPSRIYDREAEWDLLTRFADRAKTRPQLGVVTGRRRQGKTYLLDALTSQAGGLYFGATQATATESLALFAAALDRHLAPVTPHRFADWDEAITHLYSAPELRGTVVVLDEFSYLTDAVPALPSILQREVDRAVSRNEGPSVLLCGSALSVMGRLLAGSAPLRGRANLEFVVRPFEYQSAARYWGITDPRLAVLTHAVVGGTPAYRSFVNDDVPLGPGDFDDWVLRTVLNPGTPLFLEGRYLLAEEMVSQREPNLYHSVLAAVAAGNNTRGGIASYVGRKANDLSHYLNVWEDTGLLVREVDVFRPGRSTYRIAEPVIAFYEVVCRPRWGQLEAGRAAAVWQDARVRFTAQLLGPHFESLCRRWALLAEPGRFGGLPGEVGTGVVADAGGRSQIQVDVAVFAPTEPGRPRRLLSIGEAKWGKVMTTTHLDRLRRAVELLAKPGLDTSHTIMTCYSAAGFDDKLWEAAAADPRVQLVSAADLYPELVDSQ